MIASHSNLSTSALIGHKRNTRPDSRASYFRPTNSSTTQTSASWPAALLPHKQSLSRRSSASSATLADDMAISPRSTTKSRMWRRRTLDQTFYPSDKSPSPKRNQDFHSLFQSLPDHDSLIDDYGCALQKEILLQGRLYVSEQHVCFNANIFGWVTNVVIAFSDIIHIEKRTTAIFIPNAIQISTHQCKYFFASFLSRDHAYDCLMERWKLAMPDALSHKGTATFGEVDTAVVSFDSSDSESSSVFSLDPAASSPSKQHDSKENDAPLPVQRSDSDRRRAMSEPQLKMAQEAKPQRFEKTECACTRDGSHLTHTVLDQTYNNSIMTIYRLICDNAFLTKFLVEVEKNTNVNIGDWRVDEHSKRKTRNISYTKYLNNPLGPKSTKCLLKEEIIHDDSDHYITHVITTQTPDVPSGSSFAVRTRLCLMWAGHGQVRMLVTVIVDFNKSSWLKSAIEKGSIDGQIAYYKGFDAGIRRYCKNNMALPSVPTNRTDTKKTRNRQRRHRRHNSNHSQRLHAQMAENKFIVVARSFSAGTRWVLQCQAPDAMQVMAVCLFLLVCSNILIASKLSNVGDQLDMMRQTTTSTNQRQSHVGHFHRWTKSRTMDGASLFNDQYIRELERVTQQAGEYVDQMSRAAFYHRNSVLWQEK